MSILDSLWFNPSLAKAGDGLSQEMGLLGNFWDTLNARNEKGMIKE